jgi:hypothetical protein
VGMGFQSLQGEEKIILDKTFAKKIVKFDQFSWNGQDF